MSIHKDVEIYLQEHPDIRLLRRVPFTNPSPAKPYFPLVFNPAQGDEIEVVVLDVETTGLDCKQHEIIELGLVKLLVSASTGGIHKIMGSLSLFEQPKVPITQEITDITHITQEMVAGETFDVLGIESIFNTVSLVIAHNAEFDRGFFDTRFPTLQNLPWACSIKDIQWKNYGLEGRQLMSLVSQCGYFYEGHRADIDCIATLRLFMDKEGSMQEILHKALEENVRIHCYTAPYRIKDALKENGYKWDAKAEPAHWRKDVPAMDVDAEWSFLAKLAPNQLSNYVCTPINRFNRYKPS